MQENQGHRRTLTLNNGGARQQQKGFDYGKKRIPGSQRTMAHDKDIKRFVESGEIVRLDLISGSEVVGKVVESDKYTIKIDCTDSGIGKRTYFKHAIESIGPLGEDTQIN
jgi:hypothetical protein